MGVAAVQRIPPIAALVAVAASAAPALAGSPEADRAVAQAMWFCCCGLPLIFGALTAMVIGLAIKDARARR